MKKKIPFIVILTIFLISTNLNVISTANDDINNQSFVTLGYAPKSHDFGDMEKDEIATTIFYIWNAGCCTLGYNLYENEEWIQVQPTTGTSIGEQDPIKVTINTANLTFGYHESNINIFTNDITANFTVSVYIIPNAINDITVDQAWELLNKTSNGIQIPIDVRTEEEWKKDHIKTPFPENPKHHDYLDWNDPNKLQEFMSIYEGKEIILYSNNDEHSKNAATILVENDFNGIVYKILGGLNQWKNQGYPIDGYTTFKIMNIKGGLGVVSADIQNTGTFTAKDINIDINVVGGYLSMINFTSSCINCPVPIEPNAKETENTRKDGYIIGFGPIQITVSASASNVDKITAKKEGYLFGIIILIK